MNEQNLRNLLEQLHHELENNQNIDENGRDLLRHLGSDIDEFLERAGTAQSTAEQTLLQRLEDSIRYLEVTHPAITNTLSKILESLSNAGI